MNDTLCRKLKEELDFLHEGRNAERIAAYHQNEAVKIPNIYWQYSAPTVLVMEWCPGTTSFSVS
jgi:ubiquinone biosynthesis protein